MPFIRAVIANTVFYVNMIVWMLVFLPVLAAPNSWARQALKAWALSTMWLLKVTVGMRWEVRGLDNIPRSDSQDLTMQGSIIASKHQSTWETFGLLPYLDHPVYILKQELMRIPVFGWYCRKTGMIAVERAKNASALRRMTKAAKEAVEDGRQLIIFPEGTRRPVDAEPNYKSGVAHMYKQLGVPLVPAGLNTGLFWPRRGLVRYPGKIVVSLLPAIEPGQEPRALQATLQDLLEAETNALVQAERAQNAQLPS